MSDPIIAHAVRLPSGSISLFLDSARATAYAAANHGTLHRLVEWIEPITQPIADADAPNRRMPQGELTAGGVMRI